MNRDTQLIPPSKTASAAVSPTKLGDHFELVLSWYKINGKSLAGEERLPSLHIMNLMEILGNPIWNQIYHCWQIETKHITEIQAYATHRLDPEKYLYFIEAHNTQRAL